MNFAKKCKELRIKKAVTQEQMATTLNLSPQAISKWERGETLPDVSLLPDLARILETSIDYILLGGEKQVEYKGKVSVSDLKVGIVCLKNMGEYLGKENIIYRSAVNGINTGMNTDIEEAFTNDYVFDAFLAEAIIQNLMIGMYVDINDVKNNFKHEHFKKIVIDYCERYGIK